MWVIDGAVKERDIVKVYEGETGRSARLRGAEHLKDFEKKREKSVLTTPMKKLNLKWK